MSVNIVYLGAQGPSDFQKRFAPPIKVENYDNHYPQKGYFNLSNDCSFKAIHDYYAKNDQRCSPLFALFVPVRIEEGFINFCKDLFIPLTANYAWKTKNIASRFFACLGGLVVDTLTLPFRLLTVIPRICTVGHSISFSDDEKMRTFIKHEKHEDRVQVKIRTGGLILIENEKNPNTADYMIQEGQWYAISPTHAIDIPRQVTWFHGDLNYKD